MQSSGSIWFHILQEYLVQSVGMSWKEQNALGLYFVLQFGLASKNTKALCSFVIIVD